MVRLMLARHGETAWNAGHRYQGQSDIPLSETGKRQVAALAERLAHEEIHAIYASDLCRAWDTATSIVANHDIVVQAEPRLRELHFGAWEGLTYEEIGITFANELASWQADPVNVAPPEGESMGQVVERVRTVLEAVVREHQGQTVLLVGHGGCLQVLLCVALELTPRARWQFLLKPASLSEIRLYDEGAVLTALNAGAPL